MLRINPCVVSKVVGGCELCTEMRGAHVGTHGHEKVKGRGEEEERREKERGRDVDTTGGTYCQVGPRGVARVAPLSDSTHKREVGKTLAVRIEIRRKGKTEEEMHEREKAGDILYFMMSLLFCSS